MSDIEKIINDAWEKKDDINQKSDKSIKDAINQVIQDLDSGKSRVAEKINGEWVTHQHLKKAIMLSFRIHGMEKLTCSVAFRARGYIMDNSECPIRKKNMAIRKKLWT